MSKILVVEDSKDIRDNLVMLLQLNNYETISAVNGSEGFNIAVKENPDLIIADIMMPRMNGINLLKTLKRNNSEFNTPFIYLTAKSSSEDIRNGMNLGADDYITKPYKVEDVLNSVKSRLEKKAVQDKKFDELYTNISHYIPHELRTPLVSIIGYANLVQENLESIEADQVKDMMGIIRESSERLHHTIEKFLIYSECEFLVKNKKKSLLDESTMITEAEVKLMYNKLSKKLDSKNELDISVEDSTIKIKDDHYRLIVNELIENAIKFSTPASVIKINSAIEEKNYTITIKNFGRGMSKDELNRISAFLQFDRKKFEQAGNGLGLAIIQRLAIIYNSTFTIVSEKNMYTEVNFKFNL